MRDHVAHSGLHRMVAMFQVPIADAPLDENHRVIQVDHVPRGRFRAWSFAVFQDSDSWRAEARKTLRMLDPLPTGRVQFPEEDDGQGLHECVDVVLDQKGTDYGEEEVAMLAQDLRRLLSGEDASDGEAWGAIATWLDEEIRRGPTPEGGTSP